MRLFRRIVLALLALSMLAGLLLPGLAEAAPASSRSSLAFREVVAAPGPDAENLPTGNPEQPTLSVSRQVLLSGADVTCVGIANADRPDLRGVRLVFTGDKQTALAAVTGAHVGDRIAIFLNGRVLMAPKLLDPVTGGEILITTASDQEVAQLRDTLHRDADVPLCPTR